MTHDISEYNINFLLDAITSRLPSKRHQTPGSWLSYNCPVCTANGQSRPDTRMRGGLKIIGNGSFTINCFNCGFKTVFTPGQQLNARIKKYLKSLTFTEDEIKKLNFKAWQLQQVVQQDPTQKEYLNAYSAKLKFDPIAWPSGAKDINFWATSTNPPDDFIEVLTYLDSRNSDLINYYDFYWTPAPYSGQGMNFKDINHRIIIPFFWKEHFVGFHARTCKPQNTFRYVGYTPKDYIFNCNLMETRDYLLIVEGVLDAISLGCMASLGSTLTKEQINWINSYGKKVIILPDRDKAGKHLTDIAIKNNWLVSFPWQSWDENVKDAADAVAKYGRLWVLKTVMDNITGSNNDNDVMKIKVKEGMLVGGNR
jgi:hypothetical protein